MIKTNGHSSSVESHADPYLPGEGHTRKGAGQLRHYLELPGIYLELPGIYLELPGITWNYLQITWNYLELPGINDDTMTS